MKAVLVILCLLACECTVSGNLYGQTVRAETYPQGNEAVSIEKFEWVAATGGKPPIAARFLIRNKAKNKNITSVQFTIVASDSKGVILQQDGTTLRKLTQKAMIETDQTGTFYFEKALDIPSVASIVLKQVIVEYTNGSLEILSQ
jgi:hypothetical protein